MRLRAALHRQNEASAEVMRRYIKGELTLEEARQGFQEAADRAIAECEAPEEAS